MVKFIFSSLIIILLTSFSSLAQDSQLQYCKHEAERLENKVIQLQKLMVAQNKDNYRLKERIVEQDDINRDLQEKLNNMNSIAINIINVAIKFEQEEKYQEAMEIYKLLVKSFPSSLEAASSRIQIEDLRDKL